MATKFEKLIEYVINDEEQKARDLFHEIVVEKSRGIYENLMAEDAKEEELEEAKEESEEEELEESFGMEEGMGGDAADELLQDVAYEEEGMTEEEEIAGDFAAEVPADDMGAEMGDMDVDMGGEEEHQEIENTVMNIDSKLDELLAKFEEVIGSEAGEAEEAGEEEAEDFGGEEAEAEEEEEVEESLAENVQLQKVSVDSAEGSPVGTSTGGYKNTINKKSVDAANAGKNVTGSVAQPVKTKGATTNPDGTKAPSSQKPAELVGKVANTPATGKKDLAPATKPHLAQATGVNTKSPIKGIKG